MEKENIGGYSLIKKKLIIVEHWGVTLIRAEPFGENSYISLYKVKQNMKQSKSRWTLQEKANSKKTKNVILVLLILNLCIPHINEPFYHAKTDYCGSGFIINISVKEA